MRPCFENILPPHKALSTSSNNNATHQHVPSEYQNTAAISPTIYNNKIQEETTTSYHTHHQSSDLPPNTPPKVPPRGLTYLRRNSSGCGLDKDETTSPPPPKSLGSVGGIGSVGQGYGIASRAHDLQLYSDMSVVPQSTPCKHDLYIYIYIHILMFYFTHISVFLILQKVLYLKGHGHY